VGMASVIVAFVGAALAGLGRTARREWLASGIADGACIAHGLVAARLAAMANSFARGQLPGKLAQMDCSALELTEIPEIAY